MIDTILSNFRFSRIIYIIKRKLYIVIILGILGASAGCYYGYKHDYSSYLARISLYVYSNNAYINDNSINITSQEFTMAKNLVPSYMLVLKSDTVMNKIIEDLEMNCSVESLQGRISSSAIEDTAVFYVYVIDSDPYLAMNIANAIADIAPSEISRVVKSGGVEVLDYAKLPYEPYSSSNIYKYILLGGVGLGGLAFIIVLFLGLLDTTIREKSEITSVFTIPVIGEIPIVHKSSRKNKDEIIIHSNSPFAYKESYNSLRTNLMFTGKGEKCPVFAITSTVQGEGKTINAINIAISFAQLDKKVLIIDGDLRNSSFTSYSIFENNSEKGLSQYLAGITEKINIIDTKIDNLSFISAGTFPPNPAELLSSNRFSEMLTELKTIYDYIIIDLPPIGIVSDALIVAPYVTEFIYIIYSNVCKLSLLKSTIVKFEPIDTTICGFVMNAINPKNQKYSKGKYKYGYGSDGKKKK